MVALVTSDFLNENQRLIALKIKANSTGIVVGGIIGLWERNC